MTSAGEAGISELEAPAVPPADRQGYRPGFLFLPLVTSLILLIPTILYWGHERSVMADFQQSRVSQYRLRLAKRIQTEIESQLRPLRRLAREMESGDVHSPAAFASSAKSICREEPTLKYIAWVDASASCISAFPPKAGPAMAAELAGSFPISGRMAGSADGLLRSFPAADPKRSTDRLIILPINPSNVNPGAGASGLAGGAIVTCETTQALLGALIPPDASAPFIVELKDERGQLLFASDGSPEAEKLLRVQEVDQVPVLDQSWTMRVAAAPPGLGQRPAGDTGAFLICGVVVSLMGGATVAQAGRHRRRERRKTAEHMAVLEAALQQQQRLNAQVRRDADAKAMLLRELNHRVKNNLAGIVGLLSAGVPELSEQAQEWLDRAIARIETLAQAHELFVGTSGEDRLSQVRLSDLVSKTLEPICAMKPPGVQIRMDLASMNDPLNTDQAVTLAMVVHELASNALHHGVGEFGLLCVRATHAQPGWAMIEVIDDGTGHKEGGSIGAAERVWEDAVATMPAKTGRTGIGLQLVRGLVGRELHGTFTLRENAGGGTAAVVEFPIG